MLSRRELSLLLPALAAAQPEKLPSKVLRYEDLPVRASGQNRSRAILNGATHSGFPIEAHETELAPGAAPHPPHRHVHEELMFLREGTLEVSMGERTTTIGPGSIVYAASNEHHGWRNTGSTPARYFVLALGRDE